MSKVIRLNNETQELLEKTKKDYIERLKEDFNTALKINETEKCIKIDRLIVEAKETSDSEWIWKCIHAFRVLVDIE